MEFYSGFETEPKNKRAKKVATETTEAPSQDKRMYSEKELFQIIAEILHTPALRDGSWEDIGEWFEQFKKK
jgi:hypothetical protein